MTKPLHSVLAAALMATPAIHAQQPPSPQPPQAQAAPCGASTPTPKAPPRVHFKIPPRFQKAFGKEEAKIEANTGISLDANQMLHDAATPAPAAKPCLIAPAPAPTPAKPATPPSPPPATVPAPSQDYTPQ